MNEADLKSGAPPSEIQASKTKAEIAKEFDELKDSAVLVPRQRINGRSGGYRVLQELGIGGNSAVYLVETISGPYRGVLFALKLFLRVTDPGRQERFEAEAQFLRNCDHPSIMRTFDNGEHVINFKGNRFFFPFIIAEYLPKTLRTAMLAGLSIVEKVAFTLQLLSSLSYLSKKIPCVVHRDIKPENIFVKGRSAVLGDFGLLKAGDGVDESVEYHIHDSSGIRFPKSYPTPDLIEYCKIREKPTEITPKSDVFQLGLVLAEMFGGEIPMKPREKPFSPIELVNIGLISGSQGETIKLLVEKMLMLDPLQRPSADDLFDSWEGVFLWLTDSSRNLEHRIFYN